MLRIGVISLGAPAHALNFARNLNLKDPNYSFEFYPFDPKTGYGQVNWGKVDILWNFGLYFNAWTVISHIKQKNRELKIVNEFTGTDILECEAALRQRPELRTAIFKDMDVHVTDGLGFQREIKEKFGIECFYVPSIPEHPMRLSSLRDNFAVAVYMPRERLQFYQYPIIDSVARSFPSVGFFLFPSHEVAEHELEIPVGIKDPPENIQFMDFVKGLGKKEWWCHCSVLIAIPIHGSVPVTGIEFMQMGRAVISNQEIPYMIQARNAEEIVAALKTLMRRKKPNLQASKYYSEEYSPQKQLQYVLKVLKKL